jgi:serine protease Do
MRLKLLRDRRWAMTVSTITVLAVTFFLGLGWATIARNASENQPATVKVSAAPIPAAERGYSAMVKQVLPAVVNISSTKITKSDVSQFRGPQGVDPFFRQFFGNDFFKNSPVPKERREKSLGSGVIVSPEGYILTNNHVVDHASEVMVTMSDKREFKARVVGTDPRTDVAVLKIDGSNFPSLTLADSSKIAVGDVVLAIGDPFGVGQTVTQGIVSAMGRSGLGIEQVEDFIQTDAPINPGNSGGALVDVEGRLIGINTAILGSSGGSQGIGFAVPINMARADMDQIIAHGKVDHGYLGILPQDVTPALAKNFNTEAKGALVGEVTPNSPASRGEVKTGDIILSVNGQPVEDANQLRLKVGMLAAGTDVKLSVLRDGKPLTLAVKLGEFPSTEQRASVDKENSNGALQGVTVGNITPDVAQEMNIPAQTKGVVVQEVDPSSHAAEAGLQPGDVIQQLNHRPVKDMQDFSQAMNSAKKDSPVLVLIDRGGSTMFLAV